MAVHSLDLEPDCNLAPVAHMALTKVKRFSMNGIWHDMEKKDELNRVNASHELCYTSATRLMIRKTGAAVTSEIDTMEVGLQC